MKTPQEKILEYKKLFTKKTLPDNIEERIKILSRVKAKKKDKLSRKDVADCFFSMYVRIKNSYIKNWIRCCKCVTCNAEDYRRHMQAWHYRSRGCLKYRFDENQVFPQCYTCNVIKNGNYRNYKMYMDKKVWPEMEEIYRNDNGLVKYNIVRYQTHIYDRYDFIKPILENEMS